MMAEHARHHAAFAIAKKVFVSALVGVAAAAVVFDPITLALYQHYIIHNDYWFEIGLLEAARISISQAPAVFVLGLIVSSPLIAISVFTAVLFRSAISRHLGLWCCIAPFSVWMVVCCCTAALIDNLWAQRHAFPTRLWYEMTSIDGSIYFLAPLVSSICFYVLARRGAGEPRSSASQQA